MIGKTLSEPIIYNPNNQSQWITSFGIHQPEEIADCKIVRTAWWHKILSRETFGNRAQLVLMIDIDIGLLWSSVGKGSDKNLTSCPGFICKLLGCCLCNAAISLKYEKQYYLSDVISDGKTRFGTEPNPHRATVRADGEITNWSE